MIKIYRFNIYERKYGTDSNITVESTSLKQAFKKVMLEYDVDRDNIIHLKQSSYNNKLKW